jgi:hypothetical protein
MVVAFIALLLALGGASYAAVKLPSHSVGSKELKRAAVTRANIKNNAIDGSKVAANALTGSDILETSLGPVPSATNAAHAGAAGAVDRVVYRTVAATVGPGTGDPANPTTISPQVSVACDPGQAVTGGGVVVEDPLNEAVHDNYPSTARTWTAVVGNDDAIQHSFTVYAVCIPAATVG